jgi:hypothetical protein
MAIILPHIFQDGVDENASGVQVDENLNVLKSAIELLEARVAGLEATNANRSKDFALAEVLTGRALSTNYTPSATRAAMVLLSVRANPTDARAQVYIDGTAVIANGGVDLVAGKVNMLSFEVKAGGTWQCVAAAGPMDLLTSTYVLLPKA